jgi:hypothetical protein
MTPAQLFQPNLDRQLLQGAFDRFRVSLADAKLLRDLIGSAPALTLVMNSTEAAEIDVGIASPTGSQGELGVIETIRKPPGI